MYFTPPNFGMIPSNDNEEEEQQVCSNDEEEECVVENKYDVKLKANPDFKYKCFKVAEIFKTEDFEDIYINETQGICYCFLRAETLKRAKYRIWKLLRSHDLNEYFGPIEVTEIGDGS